jgi:hypothetical protein
MEGSTPAAAMPADVGNLDPLDVFENEHTPGAVTPVDKRDVDAVVAGEHFREALGVIRFFLVIQLVPQGCGELLEERRQIGAATDRRVMHDPAGDNAQGCQIRLYQPLNAWSLDLDDHRRATRAAPVVGAKPGAVDLPERGGGQRLRLNLGKVVRQARPAQRAAPPGSHQWDGRYLILQALQLLGHLGGKNIDARAEELAQLDEDAAHLDSQVAKTARDATPTLARATPGHAG